MNKQIFLIVLVAAAVAILAYGLYRGDERVSSSPNATSTPLNSAEGAPPGSIHNLPVPGAVERVRQLVSVRTGVPSKNVVILEALEHEWPNGCLGLAAPDEFCTQVMTPGYKVVVTAQGIEYAFRTNNDGSVIREEK